MHDGRTRRSCTTSDCGYTYYGECSMGTGAVVLRDNRILLIERHNGDRVYWQIPGGYVEIEEQIETAVEREVLEETGISARVIDVLGFRHAAGVNVERPASNIYVVFRLEASATGEPTPDGQESFAAGFFTREEIAELPGVSAMTHWAVEKAVTIETSRGFTREAPRDGLQRPGHTLFGLPLP
jgi:ADP-ribose pyrophosphatase YjhB (NUDIX family)